MQLVPVNLTNPPVDSAKKLTPPPEVEVILRAACYDCHSDETQWPWYAKVAPVSWWIANHVQDGRRKLNLSHWADLTPRAGRRAELNSGAAPTRAQYQRKLLGDMETEILEGKMPLSSYLPMHPDARMTPAQYKIVADWMNATMAQLAEPPPTGATK
jgi:hypothetical protein